MTILNLTQHAPTTEQFAVGVVEPSDKKAIQSLLTFNSIPTVEEMKARAEKLAAIAVAENAAQAMVGGAPYFMATLEAALKAANVQPLYSFTQRETVEVMEGDTVKKTAVFKHVGFVQV